MNISSSSKISNRLRSAFDPNSASNPIIERIEAKYREIFDILTTNRDNIEESALEIVGIKTPINRRSIEFKIAATALIFIFFDTDRGKQKLKSVGECRHAFQDTFDYLEPSHKWEAESRFINAVFAIYELKMELRRAAVMEIATYFSEGASVRYIIGCGATKAGRARCKVIEWIMGIACSSCGGAE